MTTTCTFFYRISIRDCALYSRITSMFLISKRRPLYSLPWVARPVYSAGRRQRANLSSAGIRSVSEAPRRWSSYRLHEAETSWHHAGRLQRRTGARSTRSRCHSARRQSLQAHLAARVRRSLRRLHQLQVSGAMLSLCTRHGWSSFWWAIKPTWWVVRGRCARACRGAC